MINVMWIWEGIIKLSWMRGNTFWYSVDYKDKHAFLSIFYIDQSCHGVS